MSSKAKQMRVRLNRLDLIPVLRDKMNRMVFPGTTTSRLNPDAHLTDSTVIDFALVMADVTLSEHLMLIDKRKFLDGVNADLNRHIKTLASIQEDERASFVEYIITSQANVAPAGGMPPAGGRA